MKKNYFKFNFYLYCGSFPDSSLGKESTCDAGNPSQYLGQEDLLEKGQATLQYSWVFLVAQVVKNPPAMWETWVQPLGWADPLEKGKAYPFQYCSIVDLPRDRTCVFCRSPALQADSLPLSHWGMAGDILE